MEKFLCFMKLSKGSKIIGCIKLISSVIGAIAVLCGLSFENFMTKFMKSSFSPPKIQIQNSDSRKFCNFHNS